MLVSIGYKEVDDDANAGEHTQQRNHLGSSSFDGFFGFQVMCNTGSNEWGRPGILCGFNGKIGRESSFNNDAKYEGVTRDTPLLENSRESLKKLVIS
ncbi:unnamed protein product [Sphagnum jensenii]|uniref:Uncharacterized protein n=1 Tax=Sphagnum jensenii TaxID=128206 RepID=A0ABP1ADV1_9BRYO